ncbi:hypothetical protein AB0C31_52255, partial [Actinoplanes philippinensis]
MTGLRRRLRARPAHPDDARRGDSEGASSPWGLPGTARPPCWGCGMIMLAGTVLDGRPDQESFQG